ncbi:MAG: extracellular solute-binding protein [Eisenbergiella sp.]
MVSATDNYWTRWIQQEFGDPNNITLKYIPVPRNEETQKINTMMASASAPDIIFSYDSNMIIQYGKDGGLVELTGLIDQYGSNLKENLGDSFPMDSPKASNGLSCETFQCRMADYYIRKDWLDEVGYELQTDENGYYHMSIDDFTELLHQFRISILLREEKCIRSAWLVPGTRLRPGPSYGPFLKLKI